MVLSVSAKAGSDVGGSSSGNIGCGSGDHIMCAVTNVRGEGVAAVLKESGWQWIVRVRLVVVSIVPLCSESDMSTS